MTIAPGTHPVLLSAQTARSALVSVAELDPVFMPPREKAAALIAVSEALAAAAALQARLLAAAGDVAEDFGARDAASWLNAQVHGDPGAARRSLQLGRSLESLPLVSAALSVGRIDALKAQLIARALEGLPADVSARLRDQAEATLVEQAPSLAPKELAKLCRHLEAVVDPDGADEAEGRALLRDERSAWEKTSLRISPRFDGTCRITGVVPEALGHRLRTYLEAFAQPRAACVRVAESDGVALRPDQRTGRALCDLLERINPATLPDHGGDATTIVVTIPLADLRREVGGGSLGGTDAAGRVSASDVRRLACSASIIPAVLGSKSQVLELGRAQRLFTPAQRKALRTQHATCQAEGCDVPSTWCDAHHEVPWSTGGATDLKNALLLCGHHHRRIHDPRFVSEKKGDRVSIRLRR